MSRRTIRVILKGWRGSQENFGNLQIVKWLRLIRTDPLYIVAITNFKNSAIKSDTVSSILIGIKTHMKPNME